MAKACAAAVETEEKLEELAAKGFSLDDPSIGTPLQSPLALGIVYIIPVSLSLSLAIDYVLRT